MDKKIALIIKDLREKYGTYKGTNSADKVLKLCDEYESINTRYEILSNKIAEIIIRARKEGKR
jgi:hypothetical protein